MEVRKSYSDALRAFYVENLRPMEFGSAVADVILVPILVLNLLGVITIKGPFTVWLVAIFAFIDVSSTAILLVAGYVGHELARVGCASCKGEMVPSILHWTCKKCGAKLIPPKDEKGARESDAEKSGV
jgi:hypothetical protein